MSRRYFLEDAAGEQYGIDSTTLDAYTRLRKEFNLTLDDLLRRFVDLPPLPKSMALHIDGVDLPMNTQLKAALGNTTYRIEITELYDMYGDLRPHFVFSQCTYGNEARMVTAMRIGNFHFLTGMALDPYGDRGDDPALKNIDVFEFWYIRYPGSSEWNKLKEVKR